MGGSCGATIPHSQVAARLSACPAGLGSSSVCGLVQSLLPSPCGNSLKGETSGFMQLQGGNLDTQRGHGLCAFAGSGCVIRQRRGPSKGVLQICYLGASWPQGSPLPLEWRNSQGPIAPGPAHMHSKERSPPQSARNRNRQDRHRILIRILHMGTETPSGTVPRRAGGCQELNPEPRWGGLL